MMCNILPIVWIYNRTRVERDKSIGGFMRFVFRRSGALIGVYVGLVMAYGAIGLDPIRPLPQNGSGTV